MAIKLPPGNDSTSGFTLVLMGWMTAPSRVAPDSTRRLIAGGTLTSARNIETVWDKWLISISPTSPR